MSVTVESDHVFATVGGATLTLDLYRPSRGDAPLVLYVHGGGWRSGDKADGSTNRLAALARHGITVASANYRLVPGTVFPGQLHDVKGAVRWLRAQGPSLGVNTDRIGIWGASAGAYLGSLLALTQDNDAYEGDVGGNLHQSSEVQAVVHWFGQSDLLVAGSRNDLEARLLPFAFEAGLLGVSSVADVVERARELSLLRLASSQAPPFLVAHGDRDHVVPPSEGIALHDALSRAGADTQLVVVGGAGHEGPEFERPAMLAMTAAWLRAKLTTAEAAPE